MSKVFKSVGKAFKSVFKAISSVFSGIINFVGDIVGFLFSPFGAFDVPGAGDADKTAQGVTLTKNGTNVAIPVIYGFRRTGGSLVYMETNGDTNKYLYAVYAVAEGEIQCFNRILVEDVELPLPKVENASFLGIPVSSITLNQYQPGVVHTVKSGRFNGRIKFEVFNGTDGQAQSSLANEAPNWSQKKRTLPGVAYAVIRFEWKEIKTQADSENNPFNGGIPKVQFDISGKKVYDVRNHNETLFLKDLQDDYADQTKTYSTNPANCLLDYLLNPRYGCGLNKRDIDAEAFKIAANKYAQAVTYYEGTQGRAMTLNAVLDTNQKLFNNVKTLVGGCRGILPYTQGRYALKVEDGGNATDITSTTVDVAFDVTKDYIIGGITLDGEKKNTKFNEVIVNYVDPDLDFTNQQVVYSVNGDQAADEDELLRKEFTFHTVTNKLIARDLAVMIYKKSRNQRAIQFTGTQELLNLTVGDIITVTDTILNLSSDTFRVVDMKLNVDLTVDISAVEHDATVYPFTTGEQIDLPAPLFLPDELTVGPRLKPVSSPPLGIVPPVDEDDDSAGGSGNPLPEQPDNTETRVTKFNSVYTASDSRHISSVRTSANNVNITDDSVVYIGAGSKFFEITNGKGLAFCSDNFGAVPYTTNYYGVTATGNLSFSAGDYIYYRASDQYLYPPTAGQIKFRVVVNIPANTAFRYVRLTGYKRDGTEVTDSIRNIELEPLKPIEIVNYTTSGERFDYVKWEWMKRTATSLDPITDGSDLGAFYTYYDAFEGKNKTEKTINALINNALQNADSVIYGIASGTTSSGNTSVSTSHNLGG